MRSGSYACNLFSPLNEKAMNTSKQIKWGAVLSYLSLTINIITGLLYTPWMVASIGESQYGLYTLANSVITLFLVDFGLSSATGRYLSKYNAEGDHARAEQFLGMVYKLYLIIDAIILMILLGVFFFMDRIFLKLTTVELEQFRVVFAISAIFSVVNFPFVTFNGILTAFEKFVPLKIADLLYRVCNIGFTVIALMLGYGLYALVTVHAVVGLFVLVFKYGIIRKWVPLKPDFRNTDKRMYKEVFGFSIWVTVSNLASRLVFNITPAILGIVANSAAIAVFGIVSTIEGYAYNITTAINGMFMPKISRIVAAKNSETDLNPLFLSVGKFQYILNGLILAGFTVVGKRFITLWMGPNFSYAYGGILLVLFPGLFYNALQIADTTMVVMNKVKMTAKVSVLTGIVNVCLSFLLSQRLGVLGSCTAICVAYLFRDILLIIIYHRELPLNIPRFVRECYLKLCIPILTTVVLGAALNQYIPDGGWGIFLFKAGVTAVIYLLMTLIFALDKRERHRILCWLKR